jgi:TusA-related sulfurtransferase
MQADKTLDARGLNCPMPLVKARLEINGMDAGGVLKVVATDKGSVADFKGWAQASKAIELVSQEVESLDGADVFVHYVKKVS